MKDRRRHLPNNRAAPERPKRWLSCKGCLRLVSATVRRSLMNIDLQEVTESEKEILRKLVHPYKSRGQRSSHKHNNLPPRII